MKRFSDWLVARLKRETTSGSWIKEIDGLRFFAILLVIWFHAEIWYAKKVVNYSAEWSGQAPQWVSNFYTKSYLGVEIFFMISGFILAIPFLKQHFYEGKQVRLRDYYQRRLTRLEPPYLIMLFVMFAIAPWFYKEISSHAAALPTFLASIIYMHTQIFGDWPLLNVVAWTLEIEVQFYVLMPLMMYGLSRYKGNRTALLIALIVLGVVVGSFVPGEMKRYHSSLLGKFPFFLVGIIFADFYISKWKEKLPVVKGADLGWIAFIVLAGVLPTYRHSHALWMDFGLSLLAAIGLWFGALSRPVIQNTIIALIGGMCYTIYLWHYPFMIVASNLMVKVLGPGIFASGWMGFHLYMTIMTVASFLISIPLFKWLERPFMKRDWWKRGRAAEPVQATSENG